MPKHNKGTFALTSGWTFLFAVCLMGFLASSGWAQATGSISGRVTDANGAGIKNISIGYYGTNRNGGAGTDEEGYYLIPGLEPGLYIIVFGNGSWNYFEEWYDNKLSSMTADPIEVFAGMTTSGINAQLTKGGEISGRITDASSQGIPGWVGVYDLENNIVRSSSTDINGYYTVTLLPSGDYKVYFTSDDFVPEWFNDKKNFVMADPVAVMIENTTKNIDAQLTRMGKISGRITENSGNGVSGIYVRVFDVNNSQEYIDSTYTDSNGDYLLERLPPSSYKILFNDYHYVTEWYNDKKSFQEADPVAVTAGSVTEHIDALLIKKPCLELSRTKLEFGLVRGSSTLPIGSTNLWNSGEGTINWTATTYENWISISPVSGQGNAAISIGISRSDLAVGWHYGLVSIYDPNACGSYCYVDVNVRVTETDEPPFGAFDTPIDGATVASSIPITGWVLDDIGVESVKIYQGTNETDRVYIGDAVLVEGARTDISNLYWDYLNKNRAGWGYMLLTNMLPNGGNGTFNLLAYATDLSGHEVLLGSKTIICDNANAVKPFGAIDTPAQGGIASGAYFANFGWVLTPLPNSIPIDGSTITVWVDGLPLGHPVYNNYRADIATLFPGYANSNGAVGYYYLNTTGYADGTHTIEWSATDSGGNTDGIGSRYFTIQNAVPAPGAITADTGLERTTFQTSGDRESKGLNRTGLNRNSRAYRRSAEELAALPEVIGTPIFIKRGLAENAPVETVIADNDRVVCIAIPEVTRLAVYLNDRDALETNGDMAERSKRLRNRSALQGGSRYEAYQLVGDELRPLPIGSSFDPVTGAFYWQAGPGFIGEYTIVLVKIGTEYMAKKTIKISIISK